MTPTARLLKQKPSLFQRAVSDTRDVNEAYLIVHNVMARAFHPLSRADCDLAPALMRALGARTLRLTAVPA